LRSPQVNGLQRAKLTKGPSHGSENESGEHFYWKGSTDVLRPWSAGGKGLLSSDADSTRPGGLPSGVTVY